MNVCRFPLAVFRLPFSILRDQGVNQLSSAFQLGSFSNPPVSPQIPNSKFLTTLVSYSARQLLQNP